MYDYQLEIIASIKSSIDILVVNDLDVKCKCGAFITCKHKWFFQPPDYGEEIGFEKLDDAIEYFIQHIIDCDFGVPLLQSI